MADPPVGPGTNATSWPERVAASAIPVVLGGAAFAVSFSNVRRVALDHLPAENPGNTEWKSWALAASVELMALGAGLAVRSRRSHGLSTAWAWAVMCVGVVATVAANLETARAPGWGTVVAVWPALAYLLAASLKATRPAVRTAAESVPDSPETYPDEQAEPPADTVSGRPHLVVDDPLTAAVRGLLSEDPDMSGAAIQKALRAKGHSFANEKLGPLVQTIRGEAAA